MKDPYTFPCEILSAICPPSSLTSSAAIKPPSPQFNNAVLLNKFAMLSNDANDGYSDNECEDITIPVELIHHNADSTQQQSKIVANNCAAACGFLNGFKLDNCCSIPLTGDLSRLVNVKQLKYSFKIYGLTSSATATHCGCLPWLPTEISKCFYVPGVNNNLISLGYILHKGGSYYAHGSRITVHFKSICSEEVLSLVSPLDPISKVHYVIQHGSSAFQPKEFAAGSVNELIKNKYKSSTRPVSMSAENKVNVVLPLENAKDIFTPMQVARARVIQDYHVNNAHPSVGTMLKAATLGFFGPQGRADVNLYAKIFDCPACLSAKYRKPARAEVHSVGASHPGEILTLDLRLLSSAGATQEIFAVDKFSGSLHVIPLTSKRADDMYTAIMNFINITYKAYQWVTKLLYADAESCFMSLKPDLGSSGIDLIGMAPEDHASMVERYIQELDKRSTAILEGLRYHLPRRYILHLHQHTAYQMNALPNDRTFKLSILSISFLLRTRGQNSTPPMMPLAFGDLCIIKLGEGQKDTIRKHHPTQKQLVPRATYGVFLGRVPNNSTTLYFLQNNGIIVIRRDFKVIKDYIPFGWEEKEAIISPCVKEHDVHSMVRPAEEAHNSSQNTTMNVLPPPPPVLIHSNSVPSEIAVNIPNNPTLQSPVDTPDMSIDNVRGHRKERAVHINIDDNIYHEPHQYNGPPEGSVAIPPFIPLNSIVDSRALPNDNTTLILQDMTDMNVESGNSERRSSRLESLSRVNYASSATNAPEITSNKREVSDGLKRLSPETDVSMNKNFYPFMDQISHDLNTFQLPKHLDGALDHQSNYCPLDSNPPMVSLSISNIDDSAVSPLIMKRSELKKGVHSQASALKYDAVKAGAAVETEMNKLHRYSALRVIRYEDLPPNAIILNSFFIYKNKTNAQSGEVTKMTARLAVDGSEQPLETYSDTYAATADQNKVSLAKAAYLADAIKNGYVDQVYMKDLDVCGAFLHAMYESKLGTRLFMRLPKNMPGVIPGTLHPMAGLLVELVKALYGLPESNMLFEKQRNIAIFKSGFKPLASDPSIFRKVEGSFNSILFVHVDDMQIISNCPAHWDSLTFHLKERFLELDINESSVQHVGVTCELSKYQPGAFKLGQSGYINKMVKDLEVPYESDTPSNSLLFSDTSNTSPYLDVLYYQKLIGCLIYALATRYDIRKEVIYLASKSSSPTVGDMMKITKVFAYLKKHPNIGPIYHTSDGPILYAHCDASFNNHFDSRSHGGSFLSIGQHSAAIAVHSRKITSCVALSSMEAEYVTLSETARTVIYMRQFLSDIGFPQLKPTTIFEDNKSAISLASCSNIPKKSRHILLRYHFIKFAVESGLIEVHYIDTKLQRADSLTKVLTKNEFISARANLLNLNDELWLFPTQMLVASSTLTTLHKKIVKHTYI